MVAFINTSQKNGGNAKLPTDLLTREDVQALKDACQNTRDRAFIAMLYETGVRIGELIDLAVGDIEDHNHGRKVVIRARLANAGFRFWNPRPRSTSGSPITRIQARTPRCGASSVTPISLVITISARSFSNAQRNERNSISR